MKKQKQMDIDEILNKETGVIAEGKLNEVIVKRTTRPNGTLRIQHDYSFCPTMAEQHTAYLTDINYLMKKYQPDELAQFIAARAHRPEIIGHDFSVEPDLQNAKNIVYNARQMYFNLPEDVQRNFKNPLEFIKFIDNPANAEKMIQLGLVKKRDVENISKDPNPPPPATPNANKDDVGGRGEGGKA